MKTIKIKVKTIILSITIVFFIIPYLFYGIGYTLFQNLEREEAGSSKGGYVSGLLKMYENYPTFKINEGETYYMIGISNYDYIKEVRSYYGNGMEIQNLKYGNLKQALVAKEYFEKGVELGVKEKSYGKNLNALINLEMAIGNNENAYKLIMKAKESKDELIYQVGLVNEIVYYGKIGEIDKGLALCEENQKYLPFLSSYKNTLYYLKGDINKIKVEQEDELTELEAINNSSLNIPIYKKGILKDVDFINNVRIYESFDESINFSKIKGTFKIDGEPVKNTKITACYSGLGLVMDNYGALGFVTGNYEESQTVYTDENGNFTFNYILPGISYDLRVQVQSALVEDKVRIQNTKDIVLEENEEFNIDIEFNDSIKSLNTTIDEDNITITYDKIEGAYGYGLIISTNGSGLCTEPIVFGEDAIEIPLNKGSLQCINLIESIFIQNTSNMNNRILLPKSYIGLVEEDNIEIEVVAYDREKNRISVSERQKVNIKKKKLNYGEKLISEIENIIDKNYEDLNEEDVEIIERKIDEAYNWFKEKLKEEPNNTEYMYPAMRIAYFKFEHDYGDEIYNKLIEIEKNELVKNMNKPVIIQ